MAKIIRTKKGVGFNRDAPTLFWQVMKRGPPPEKYPKLRPYKKVYEGPIEFRNQEEFFRIIEQRFGRGRYMVNHVRGGKGNWQYIIFEV